MFRLLLIAASIVCVTASYDDRIVGGQETTIEKFPHQVSLRNGKDHFCGGSIIRPSIVLTAGHCAFGQVAGKITVLAGATNKSETVETSITASVHLVDKIIIHPNFSASIIDCDVAFLWLKKPIEYRPTAQPIALAPVSDRPKQGDKLLATGWGLTEPNGFVLPEILHVALLPAVDLEVCRRAYAPLGHLVTENMFCAGGSVNGQATYRGDSGGPVITMKRQLVGAVSWGKPGDPLGLPKVFADLSSPRMRQFIDTVLSHV